MKAIISRIRNFLRFVLIKIIPEIRILESVEFNTSQEEKVKLQKPYKISDSYIGKGTYISSNSQISKTNIGKFCSIGPNIISGWGIHPINGISTHPYFYSVRKQNGYTIANKSLIKERKQIYIGNDVFIGANVTILDGVTIGNGAVIGAGSVVSKNIPDYAIAIGVPIKILKYRLSNDLVNRLSKIEWWNFSEEDLYMVNKYFFDVEGFIDNYYE